MREKLGVQTEKKVSKCPKCGQDLDTNSNPPKCPDCGTKPMEVSEHTGKED